MKYEVERLKGEVKITFSLDSAEWADYTFRAYQKTKTKYSLPGFRKGHAPKKVIEKYYGEAVFFDEAFNIAASKCYSTVLQENEDILPVDEPKVDILDFGGEGSDFKFVFNVTVNPEVELGEYKGLQIEKSEYLVSEEDVEKEIEAAREKAARIINIEDRAVQNGDTVNLDYSGSVDGVKFEGGTAEKQTLVIGSNSFIPGFEEKMIGMSVGQVKDLQLKFPDDYHSEQLKGKDVVFNVKVNSITLKQLPELDDEFAKDVSGFDTLEDYKRDVRAHLEEAAAQRADNENKSKLIEKITSNAKVDIPACMVESELDYMLQDLEQRFKYMYGGMKVEDYFKYTNSSVEDFRAQKREEAENSVKTRLVLKEIIKKENLQVTDEDMDEYIVKIAQSAKKDVEEYKKTVSDHQKDHMKNDIIVNKTLDALVAANNFVKQEPAKPKATAKKSTKKAEPKAESKEADKKESE